MYRVTGKLESGKQFSGNVDAGHPFEAIDAAKRQLKDAGPVLEIKASKIGDAASFKVTDARARKTKAAAPAATGKAK